jgi:hypothetical protein
MLHTGSRELLQTLTRDPPSPRLPGS